MLLASLFLDASVTLITGICWLCLPKIIDRRRQQFMRVTVRVGGCLMIVLGVFTYAYSQL